MLSILRSFSFGFFLPWRAARLIARQPRLLALSVFPLLLTLACYVWAFVEIGQTARARLTELFAYWQWNPEGFGMSLMVFLTYAITVLFMGITFSFVAGIAATPVNDFLAEQAERVAEPPLPPLPSPTLRLRLRVIGIDLVKIAAAFAVSLAILLVSLIPGLNILVFPCLAWALAFQYVSYPQTRRNEGVGVSARFFRRHPFATLGFGTMLVLAFAMPGVGILALPCAVVGGTLLYARAQDPQAPRLR